MRVMIQAVGTRGDVQPYVALGRGLRAAGHEVVLCTHARFAGLIESGGLIHAPMTDALIDLLSSEDGRVVMGGGRGRLSRARAGAALARRSGGIQYEMIRGCWAAVEAARPDVLVYHPKAYWGGAFADRLGVPAVLAPLQPLFVETGEVPAVGCPRWRLGRLGRGAYHRRTYRAVVRANTWAAGWYTRRWRRSVGGPSRRRGAGFLRRSGSVPIPVVHGFGPSVVPTPGDWPAHATAGGFWFLEADAGWRPDDALRGFLEAGPPPVYVGFGSIAGPDPGRTAALVVEALRRAGVRGLLASGWGGLGAVALSGSVHRIERAPHDWLFARVSAVVHHGGAGTTAAGLRAGRPTVVCPFFLDQPWWGRRVEALGVGPAPIPQRSLTAGRLAGAIRSAVGDAAVRGRAEALGAAIRAEDGVGHAVGVIERAARPQD